MKITKNNGFTLIEAIIVMGIFSLIMGGASMVLFSGQSVWSTLDIEIRLQENLRNAIERVSKEVGQSGSDQDGVMRLTINNGAGVNNSDIIGFSIPVCVCSNIAIDADGNVANWGAPLTWGSLSCITDVNTIVPGANGKVDICHLPPGHPENAQDLNVSTNAVSAHLAHGDWAGTCSPCTTNNNKFIEYLLNADHQLVRRVLNSAGVAVKEDIFAQNITDFQASLNADQDVVTIVVTVSLNTVLGRQITKTGSMDVVLENIGG
jgi:prepilin-type N-terminal cleavage/methylation domain-containing protein